MTKKENRNKIIMGMIIIFLMVSSVLGFIYTGSNTKKINGFKFTQVGTSWQVWIDEIDSYLYFNYLPDELGIERLDFNSNSFDLINVNWAESNVQILQTLLLYKNLQTKLIEGSSMCTGPSVILDKSGNFDIYLDGDCLYLEGDSTKILEAVKYKVFGVV